MIKNIIVGAFIAGLLGASALAGQPVTIQNSANTAAVGVTGTSLNVNVTGSSGTPSVVQGNVSNASSGVATSATNVPTVSYTYYWNGTTWDQAKTAPAITTNGLGLAATGIASVFMNTPPTRANGEYGALQMTSDGSLRVQALGAASATKVALPANTAFYGAVGSSSGALPLASAPFLYNGTAQDAQVSITGALTAGATPTGVTAVEHAGTPWTNITSNTTTLVKSGPTFLHQICINTKGASANVATVFNNTTATGATLGAIDTTANAQCFVYDAYLNLGLTVLTATGTAANLTVTYR